MKTQPFAVPAAILASASALLLTACAPGGHSQAAAQRSTTTPGTASVSARTGAPSSASASDYCALAGPANAALAASAEANGDAAAASQLRTNIKQALAAAPPEIKGDVQVMADIELPILDGKVAQDRIDKQLGDPRMQAAIRHIAEWSRAHCPTATVTP